MNSCIRALCAALLFPALACAAPRDDLLVSAEWLAAHLDDPALVILHIGAGYRKQHIRGARPVSLEDITVSDHSDMRRMRMLDLPSPEDLRRRLEALGIGDASRVVVYFGDDEVSPATRVLFTLDAAGFGARSALLDGGLPAWIRDGHPVTREVPAAPRAALAALAMQARVVDAEFVRRHAQAPGFALIDGRAAALYDGVDTGGSPMQRHKTGHIAGARSLPFSAVTDLAHRLRPEAALRALFDAAGVKPGDTIVAYCHIGQQATAVLFAARTLGHPVQLYDGSFEDWSLRDLPVVPSAAP